MAATRFFGRMEERVRFGAALDETRSGRFRTVLLSGPPGIGKTRLAGVLADDAETAGFLTLFGAWREDIELPEFWMWRQVLRRLIGIGRVAKPGCGLDSALSELFDLLPELRDERPDLPSPLSEFSTPNRLRLLDAIGRIFRRSARDRPLLLVLDNLHLAGTASLELLAGLKDELSDSPVILLGAFRSPHPHEPAGCDAWLRSLLSTPGVEEFSLGGLSAADAAGLLESELGGPCDIALQDRVIRLTKGHPLYVREAGRLCRDRLASGTSALEAIPWGELPRAVSTVVARRFSFLSPEGKEVLSAAALVGEHVSMKELLWACKGREEKSLDAALEEAAVQGFLEAQNGEYRFSHTILHEALRIEIPPYKRREICARLAAAAERSCASDLKPWAFKLSLWWGASEGDEGLAKSRLYARLAADTALKAGAWEQAAELYKKLLSSEARFTDAAEESELCLSLGRAYFLGGRRVEAVEPLRRAFDLFKKAGDLARMTEIATLPGYLNSGDPGFFDFVGELMKSLPPDYPGMGTILHFWGVTQFNHYGDYSGAEKTLREAEKLGKKAGDRRLQCTCLTALAFVHNRLQRFEEALDDVDRAETLLAGVEDSYAEMHYNILRYQLQVDGGAPEAAAPFLDRWIDLSLRNGDAFAIGCAHFSRARIEVCAGDWVAARRYIDAGLSVVPDNVFLLSCRCHLEYALGDFKSGDRYRARLSAEERRTPRGPYTAHMHAASTAIARAFQTGDARDLSRYLAILREMAKAPGAHPFILFRVRILLALAAWLTGDAESARRAYRDLNALPRVYVVHPFHLERARGLAAHACGDHPAAARHLREAASRARHYGNRPAEAWIRFELGEALSGPTAGAENLAEARRAVLESLEAARSLGMPPLEERARRKLDELSGLLTEGAPDHAHLSRREREILALVADGLTNKAIASRLGISAYTVANHLRHILEKTGTANRTEAVLLARRLERMNCRGPSP